MLGGWEAGLLDQQWKGVRRDPPVDARCLEIFDIVADPGETTDLAVDRPDLVARFESLFAQRRWPHCHLEPFRDVNGVGFATHHSPW